MNPAWTKSSQLSHAEQYEIWATVHSTRSHQSTRWDETQCDKLSLSKFQISSNIKARTYVCSAVVVCYVRKHDTNDRLHFIFSTILQNNAIDNKKKPWLAATIKLSYRCVNKRMVNCLPTELNNDTMWHQQKKKKTKQMLFENWIDIRYINR